MKKIQFALLALALCLAAPASAQGLNQGFKMMFDFGGGPGLGDHSSGNISTTATFGYQFNKYLFLGGGTGVSYYTAGDGMTTMPFYAAIRGTLATSSEWTPFAEMRMGYYANFKDHYDGSYYVAPTVGVRYAITSKFGLSLGVGFQIQGAPYDHGDAAKNFMFKVGLDI